MSKYYYFFPACMLALSGCNMAPDYRQPVVELPSQLHGEITPGKEAETGLDRWWERFNDPYLDEIIEQALSANSDLAIAAARIMEARAILGQANADFFPTIGGNARASRRGAPDHEVQPGMDDPGNSFSVSGLLDYEVDLFGKIRNRKASAREHLLASSYGYYSIRNALIAQIVTLYFQGVAVEEQIDLAEQTIITRQAALDVQQKRYDSGFITQLQLQQTKAELADAHVTMPVLQELLHAVKVSLHLIAGTDPALYWNGDPYTFNKSTIPDTPEINPDILPATLLERRPDVLAAEAELKAAYRDIGIARAQRWPALSISGLLGTSGNDVEDLFTDPTGTWSLAGALSGPVYDFGRSRNRVRASESKKNQAGWNYRQVVLKAMGEVNNSLAAVRFSKELVFARQAQREAFDKTLELARLQYQEGYSDYLELLDAERRSFDSQLALVEARYGEIVAYVNLCKAMGGGWNQEVDDIEVPEF